ncbi:hypothetical protein AB6A40_000253 [Gnathostoma spinigerum]|uniref:MARVEL domain-containing protein n=1 Tax=Gnathostoma spinigerum TaxID=75299 RepID=A0ABD6E1Q3_9BILA
MSAWGYPFGSVKVVPAYSFYDPHSQRYCYPTYASYWQDPYVFATSSSAVPLNALYYMDGMYGSSYAAHIYDPSSYVPYGQDTYSERSLYGAYYNGAYSAVNGTYRSYPQPRPSPNAYRRSRTAPSRDASDSAEAFQSVYGRRPRGYSTDPFGYQSARYVSTPTKSSRNAPVYRKRREPTSRSQATAARHDITSVDSSLLYYPAIVSGATLSRRYHRDVDPVSGGFVAGGASGAAYPSAEFSGYHPSLRRYPHAGGPYYTPSYSTYPPSIMQTAQRKNDENRAQYPLAARLIMKAIEVVIGAVVLGLVLAPTRTQSFYDFITQTKTEWQGLVVGISAIFGSLALIMLFSAYCAHKAKYWQRIDAFISVIGIFLYLLAGAVEAYFAACYPPYGREIGRVCHRTEWIIATVLLFINFVVYIVDVILSLRSGVTIL